MASEKIMNIIEEIKVLSVLELSELVDAIQEEFGVTAAIAVAGGAAGGAAPAEAEKTEFDVILASFGEKKMDVIKAVFPLRKLRRSLRLLLRLSRKLLPRLRLKSSRLSSKLQVLQSSSSNYCLTA